MQRQWKVVQMVRRGLVVMDMLVVIVIVVQKVMVILMIVLGTLEHPSLAPRCW